MTLTSLVSSESSVEPLPALTNGVIVSFSPQEFCRFYSLFSRVLENKDFLVPDFGRRLVLLDRVHCGNSDELPVRSVRSVKRGEVPLICLQVLEARPSMRAPAPSLRVKRPVNADQFHQIFSSTRPRRARLLVKSHLQQRRPRPLCQYPIHWPTPLYQCSGRNLCGCHSGTFISH